MEPDRGDALLANGPGSATRGAVARLDLPRRRLLTHLELTGQWVAFQLPLRDQQARVRGVVPWLPGTALARGSSGYLPDSRGETRVVKRSEVGFLGTCLVKKF